MNLKLGQKAFIRRENGCNISPSKGASRSEMIGFFVVRQCFKFCNFFILIVLISQGSIFERLNWSTGRF
jgi:hypothetical protein